MKMHERAYESYSLYAKHVLSFKGFGHFVFSNPGGVNRQAASDVPLERLKRLEKRLKYHRHGLRKADGAN